MTVTPPEIRLLQRSFSRVHLFMFSAVTWNPHRIHYDADYARQEGYPDIIVQSHLHASLLMETLTRSLEQQDRVVRFAFRNRRFAVVDSPLTCTGSLVETTRSPEGVYAVYDLEERDDEDRVCADARATVLLAGDTPS